MIPLGKNASGHGSRRSSQHADAVSDEMLQRSLGPNPERVSQEAVTTDGSVLRLVATLSLEQVDGELVVECGSNSRTVTVWEVIDESPGDYEAGADA